MMSAAVESLHIQYPGRFRTDVECCAKEIYWHNPRVTKVGRAARRIKMDYPTIQLAHIPDRHFMRMYCDFLGEQLGVPLPLKVNRPYLYLSREEASRPKLPKTWLINSGYKKDCAAKWWGRSKWQEVVDRLPDLKFLQVGERHANHVHTPLVGRNVTNHVGQTNTRELLVLANQCQGGCGPASFLQHVFAAHQLPYVCVNTREPHSFMHYHTQTIVSANGCLSCNRTGACWASSFDQQRRDNKCQLPVIRPNGEQVGRCADVIQVEEVVRAIRKYAGEPHGGKCLLPVLDTGSGGGTTRES